MKIVWTEPTVDDLNNIKDFIKRDSLYYSEIFTSKPVNSVDKLVKFPEIGRIVPEFNIKNIRELIYKIYRIIYKFEKETVYILTVIHGARDLKKNLKKSKII